MYRTLSKKKDSKIKPTRVFYKKGRHVNLILDKHKTIITGILGKTNLKMNINV